MFKFLPNTVENIDMTYPEGFWIRNSRLKLPPMLKALRLRADGRADGQKPLLVSMHACLQRLTLQLWGGHVVFVGPRGVFQSLTDMHVEATIINLGMHLRAVVQKEGASFQLSKRVPDKSEMYGGGGGWQVQAAHLGAWPPGMPGYDGPDVPEARACCHWPCACGACETCCRAHFWRVLGSG